MISLKEKLPHCQKIHLQKEYRSIVAYEEQDWILRMGHDLPATFAVWLVLETSDAGSVSELKMERSVVRCGEGRKVGGPLSSFPSDFRSTVML